MFMSSAHPSASRCSWRRPRRCHVADKCAALPKPSPKASSVSSVPSPAPRALLVALVPNTGSTLHKYQLQVEAQCSWLNFLRLCAESLGSGKLKSVIALCDARNGRRIRNFDDVLQVDGEPICVCFAGVAWRVPPSVPLTSPELAYDASLLGVREGVVRVHASDPELPALLRARVPVVISGSSLVSEELRGKWRSAVYLRARLGEQKEGAGTPRRYAIFVATAGAQPPRYAYHDFVTPERLSGAYALKAPPAAVTSCRRGTVGEFDEWRRAEGDRFYLQSTLVSAAPPAAGGDGGVPLFEGAPELTNLGGELLEDVRAFDWEWLSTVMAHRPQGRPYKQSQLFVGGQSGVTPLHYDTYDNLLVQAVGTKRVLLLHPDQYDRCYPYPHHHPQDRQSRVVLDRVDRRRFPRWAGARTVEAQLEPGDVLHIPPYWWHQVQMMRPEGDTDAASGAATLAAGTRAGGRATGAPSSEPAYNVSLNFWFDASPWEEGSPVPLIPPEGLGYISPELASQLQARWPKQVSLEPFQLVGLGRDLEATIARNLGAPSVGHLLRKAMPEAGATDEAWAPTVTQQEMAVVRTMNIALFARGFDPSASSEFLRTLYRGRFEGLEQHTSAGSTPAGKRTQTSTPRPKWWA